MTIRIGIQSPSHRLCSRLKVIIENSPELDLECVAKSVTKQKFQMLVEETTPDMVLLDTITMAQSAIESMALKYRENYPDMNIILIAGQKPFGRAETITLIDIGINGHISRKSALKKIIDAITTVASGNRYLNGRVVLPNVRPAPTAIRKQTLPRKPKKLPNLKGEEVMDILSLSPREKEILRVMLANENYTTGDIGDMLGISQRTVENYRGSIMKKFGVNNRLALFKQAIKYGMLSVQDFLKEKSNI